MKFLQVGNLAFFSASYNIFCLLTYLLNTLEAVIANNNMDSDQTAPLEHSDQGSYVFASMIKKV